MTGVTGTTGLSRFESVVAYLLFAVYAGLQIVLFATHVPWADEGQAWYWALALQKPVDFLIVPGEGHPPLWYLLLRFLSLFLDFDHARLLTLCFAIINGGLILRLFRHEIPLAALVLLSGFALHYWGFQFRPYAIVLTLALVALLYAQAGRFQIGVWLLAIACGFHFFAGFLFAFWLILCWRRGLPFRQLFLPALVALGFGLTSVLSGMGNPSLSIALSLEDVMLAIKVFAAPFALIFGSLVLDAIVVAALIVIMFRRDPKTLIAYFGVAALFCLFAAFVYGRYGWHIAFLVVLLLMAFATSKPRPHPWPLYLLLLPGLVFGIVKATDDILVPPRDGEAFRIVVQDAGAKLDPASNFLVWPDDIILGITARTDMPFISANNGTIGGPIHLRNREKYRIDKDLLKTLPHPYWLVCETCTPLLDEIRRGGYSTVELYAPDPKQTESIGAYRIE